MLCVCGLSYWLQAYAVSQLCKIPDTEVAQFDLVKFFREQIIPRAQTDIMKAKLNKVLEFYQSNEQVGELS